MIAVFLAQGFEEIEALAVVDVLRRAELPQKTVGMGRKGKSPAPMDLASKRIWRKRRFLPTSWRRLCFPAGCPEP